MGTLFKSTLAAAALIAAAGALAPASATAGVMSLTAQQAAAPSAASESVHWRPYCHRHHWRHYGYCGTCGYRTYGYAYPNYYGYYGYSNPLSTAVGVATWPFLGWW